MALNRVRVSWQNFPGAPGLSTFYLDSTTTDVTAIKTFFTSIKDEFPINLSFVIPSSGDVIDTGTGKITGGWSGTGGGTVTAAGTTLGYSGTSGAMIRWTTNTVTEGHRVAGRTYFVPLKSTGYDTSGSLATATVAIFQGAANSLIAALTDKLFVFHRPRNSSPTDPGSPGIAATVNGALVPDLAVVMRSRRI